MEIWILAGEWEDGERDGRGDSRLARRVRIRISCAEVSKLNSTRPAADIENEES